MGRASAQRAKTLQSHMVRLRDDLGRAGGVAASVIATSRTGYGIDLCLERGRRRYVRMSVHTVWTRSPARMRPPRSTHLDQALAWWRGVAYAEFGDSPFAVAERMRLTELRALALESRTDAALGSGPVGGSGR